MVGNRSRNLALGLSLGWMQQGAAFGGRPLHELTADLERIRNHASADGYSGFGGYVDAALTKLNTGQPPANIVPEITALIGVFQGASSGQAAQALNVGINLGWLQQGARAGNRAVPTAIQDLDRVKQHAPLAGYHNFQPYVDAALSKLRAGQAITAILGDVTATIGVLQGQN
jgi:hypothetical protein